MSEDPSFLEDKRAIPYWPVGLVSKKKKKEKKKKEKKEKKERKKQPSPRVAEPMSPHLLT